MKYVFKQDVEKETPPPIELKHEDGRLEVEVFSFSSTDAEEIRKHILELDLSTVKDIELDMKQVESITSAGIGALIALRQALKEMDITLTLKSIQPQVLEVFQICNAEDLFKFSG